MARKSRQYSDIELKELYDFFHYRFNYDPKTGHLTWKNPHHKIYTGKTVGSLNNVGYSVTNITFKGKRIKWFLHRVCYLMHYGTLPDMLDHKNHDKTDNRICNLRDGTDGGNERNVTSRKGSSSQYLGVHWDDARNKWHAQIKAKNRPGSPHIGRFDCEVEAAKAYDREARRYFKEFANLNFPEEVIDE